MPWSGPQLPICRSPGGVTRHLKLRVRPTGRFSRRSPSARSRRCARSADDRRSTSPPPRPIAEPDRQTSAAYQVLGPKTFDDAQRGRRAPAPRSTHRARRRVRSPPTAARSRPSARSASRSRRCPRRRAGAAARHRTLAFPPADSNYHDYAEMIAEINQLVAANPAIARKLTHRHLVRGPGHAADQDLRQRRAPTRTSPRSCSTPTSTPAST